MPKISLLVKSLVALFCWRLILVAATWMAPQFISFQPSYPYWEGLINIDLPRQILVWAGFDGVHYLKIAESGYIGTGLIQAFFPIYPYLIRWLSAIISLHPIILGLIISHLSLWGCLFFSHKIITKKYSTKVAWYFWLTLLLFPTSYYFGALYNESLYLFLILGSVWWGLTQKKTFLGIWGGLSSGVRLVGLSWLLGWFGQIVWQKVIKQRFNLNKLILKKLLVIHRREILGWMIGVIPLIVFVCFLWKEFGDPLYFYSVQSLFGAGRETHFIFLPQTFYRSIKILITARPFDWKYFSYAQDFILSGLMLAGLWAAWKKIPISWRLFSMFSFLLPTLTGNLSSMPRYVLVIWPILLWWSIQLSEKPRLAIWYYVVVFCLLILNTMLFVQGHWVA